MSELLETARDPLALGACLDEHPRPRTLAQHRRKPIATGLYRTRTNLDSQFQTFVHEITHMVLNTDDVAVGQKQSRMLVRESPFRAKNNADNWGYFVEECVFRSKASTASPAEDLSDLSSLFG